MTRHILLEENGTRECDMRALGTTRAGNDVITIDGELWEVRAVSKSGWCLDSRCDACTWARCGCDCHGGDAA